ncbi:hypothetical protein BH20GEM2_BH20GEM2_13340 [soil metagenome]
MLAAILLLQGSFEYSGPAIQRGVNLLTWHVHRLDTEGALMWGGGLLALFWVWHKVVR